MNHSLEKLNIALVHEWIVNYAGSEKVLTALSEMFPKADIFTTVYNREKVPQFNKKKVRTSFLQNIPLMKSKRELLIPFAPYAFEQFDLSKYDLVISSTTMAAKGVITKPDCLHISYCHTPPRYLYEPDVDPRAKRGSFSWLRNKTMHSLRLWDRVAADRVDYFIANSEYVRRRINKYYRTDAKVIYPPVDVAQYEVAKNSEKKDYYLFVSRLVDYKRCDIVVEAFNRLEAPLVVIGYGPEESKLKQLAKGNIKFVGGKFGAELSKYYREAKALVFAAEEDFGLVSVEAQACGTPVIAFGKGGSLESIEDGKSGIFFGEQNPVSIVESINRFEKMSFDPKNCRLQAEKFSNDIFKKEIEKFIIDKYNGEKGK